MSDAVTAAGIEWENHSDPANLDRWGVPDLVVVGNQTRPANLELEAVRQRGHPVRQRDRVLRDASPVTACGSPSAARTARRPPRRCWSTSSSARAWIPGFRLGSTSLDLGGTSRLGTGPFVFEGDEYTSAPWDPRPKFLHTRPHGACVTRLELDHPDVYASLEAYREPFVELASDHARRRGARALRRRPGMPRAARRGHRCCCHLWHEVGQRLADPSDAHEQDGMQRFRVERERRTRSMSCSPFPGSTTRRTPARRSSSPSSRVSTRRSRSARARTSADRRAAFRSSARSAGVAVVDDYAHHPTEVAAAIDAARQRYPGRRLIAIHTPHTYSRVSRLLEDYRQQLHRRRRGDHRSDRGGARARHAEDRVQPGRRRPRRAGRTPCTWSGRATRRSTWSTRIPRPGDVLLVLSLGGFDKLAPRLRDALEAQGVRR